MKKNSQIGSKKLAYEPLMGFNGFELVIGAQIEALPSRQNGRNRPKFQM